MDTYQIICEALTERKWYKPVSKTVVKRAKNIKAIRARKQNKEAQAALKKTQAAAKERQVDADIKDKKQTKSNLKKAAGYGATALAIGTGVQAASKAAEKRRSGE